MKISKDYKCESCGKSFGQKDNLERHVMTVHEKIKAYQCEYCDKNFGEKQNLKSHLKSVHENENRKDFSCNVCDEKFLYNSNLKRHILQFHMKIKSKAPKNETSTKIQYST